MICFPGLGFQREFLLKNTFLSCSSISCSTGYVENHKQSILWKFVDRDVQPKLGGVEEKEGGRRFLPFLKVIVLMWWKLQSPA